jgi:selenide, water dikinase
MKTLVLAGGGHSHLFVLEAFAKAPLPDVEVVLINRTLHAPYSGMLPGLIAGLYKFDECHIHLERLTQRGNIRFLQTSVTSVDLAQKTISLRDGPNLHYDVLSVNTGSTPPLANTPGAFGSVLPIKPIEDFLVGWEAMRKKIAQTEYSSWISLVGGGAGSVELALAMQHALRANQKHPPQFEIVCDTPDILMTHNSYVRRTFNRILAQRGIAVRANTRVARVDDGMLISELGSGARSDFIVWVTGATPADWPSRAGLASSDGGFIRVNEFLQSISHADVFAAGDIATQIDQPRPRSGVYAVRQGPPLAHNLRNALIGQPLKSYTPQSRALALISTGDPCAVASWGPVGFSGRWVWRWKDRIDRRFIERFEKSSA